jgi:hypothetical protein
MIDTKNTTLIDLLKQHLNSGASIWGIVGRHAVTGILAGVVSTSAFECGLSARIKTLHLFLKQKLRKIHTRSPDLLMLGKPGLGLN